jgi:hypothetical protein
MDKRKNNGGKRANSGRLKKDELISLIETMDAISVPNTVWKALYDKIKDGDTNAIKTWLQYRYGMPKQVIDQNNTHTMNDFDIKGIYDKKASE